MAEPAKQQAARAASQAKSAANNGAGAVEKVVSEATPTKDAVAEGVKRIGIVSSEVGQAGIALSVAIAAATFSMRKFKQAWEAKGG